MEPGLLVLMFPVFYATSAVTLVALAAGLWVCRTEWRARRATQLGRLAARVSRGAR